MWRSAIGVVLALVLAGCGDNGASDVVGVEPPFTAEQVHLSLTMSEESSHVRIGMSVSSHSVCDLTGNIPVTVRLTGVDQTQMAAFVGQATELFTAGTTSLRTPATISTSGLVAQFCNASVGGTPATFTVSVKGGESKSVKRNICP